MKQVIFALIFVSSLCFAEENYENYSYWDFHPIHAGGNALLINGASVAPTDTNQNTGDLYFNKENAFLYMLLPISRFSYFFPRVEWNTFEMNWTQNPKFTEKRFQYIQFALTFFTIALEKWRWITRVEGNFDVKHFSDFQHYGLFSALLWGSYEIHRKWHYHVGAIGYTGMRGDIVYPIIGVDFSPNKKWMFQIVFPITYSVDYNINKEWKFSLKGRPLKERFRADSDNPQPGSIFCYSSIGLEANLHYEKFLRCEAELFAGYNFGGSFYIKDANNNNPVYTEVGGAPYGGASFNWGF